jgi:hypothetical protein
MKRILYLSFVAPARWLLSWVRWLVLVLPLTVAAVAFVAVIHGIIRRQVGYGIYVDLMSESYLFIPCTREARRTLHRYRAVNGQKRLPTIPPWGVVVVPPERYKEVRECVQHDPISPQPVTESCRNSPIPALRNMRITEAPDGPPEPHWTVEDVMKHYGNHPNGDHEQDSR